MYSVGAIMWKWHSHIPAGKSMKWHNAYGQDLVTSSKMTNIAFDPTFLFLDIYATDTLIEREKKRCLYKVHYCSIICKSKGQETTKGLSVAD